MKPKYFFIAFIVAFVGLLVFVALKAREEAALPNTQGLIGRKLPDFSVQDSNGTSHSLRDLTRDKKTLLSFWAKWCEPCKAELPTLARLKADGKFGDVDFILVNIDSGLPEKVYKEVDAYLIANKIALKSYFDLRGALLEELQVNGIPFSLGLDSQGTIKYNLMGETDWNQEILEMQKALNAH